MTDAVNVPREWLKRLDYFLHLTGVSRSHRERKTISAMLAAAHKAEPVSDPYKLGEGEVLQWVDGYPEKFRSGEWFIALTSFGDRVCLRALPEEYSHDFTTADGTYIKADKIIKWMPFPDSEFRHPAHPEAPKVEQDYSEMKRLAEGASPGPWKACGTIYEHMNCEIRTGSKGEGQPIGQIWDGPNAFADGQFIAAASPEIVLGLIARASSPAPASDELLEAIAKDAAERVHKNGGCVPQLAYAPILFALQDGFAKHKESLS